MCPFKELSLVQHVCKFIHFVISEEYLRMLCNYMIIQTDVTNTKSIYNYFTIILNQFTINYLFCVNLDGQVSTILFYIHIL